MTLLKIPNNIDISRLPNFEPTEYFINIDFIEKVEQLKGYFKIYYRDEVYRMDGNFLDFLNHSTLHHSTSNEMKILRGK